MENILKNSIVPHKNRTAVMIREYVFCDSDHAFKKNSFLTSVNDEQIREVEGSIDKADVSQISEEFIEQKDNSNKLEIKEEQASLHNSRFNIQNSFNITDNCNISQLQNNFFNNSKNQMGMDEVNIR